MPSTTPMDTAPQATLQDLHQEFRIAFATPNFGDGRGDACCIKPWGTSGDLTREKSRFNVINGGFTTKKQD